jgi:hypothetical protein
VNQNVLDTLTTYCNGSKAPLPSYVTSDCCVNATFNNVQSKGYVSRDIFFAASCDAVSRVSFQPARVPPSFLNAAAFKAPNNGDGRFHSGAEQFWTHEYFLGASPADIRRNITDLFKPGYRIGSVRKSATDPGHNGICRQPLSHTPKSVKAKTLRSKAPTPETNTRTELHTTCIVPQFLIDESSAPSIQNPFQDNTALVKRWALHMLIAANKTLGDTTGDYFNPTVYARAHIKLKGATMDSLATDASLPRKVVDALRHYGTNLRGSYPSAFYNLTKGAYGHASVPGEYKLEDFFKLCPKDYWETGGHPLLSYQWFVKPDPTKDKYYLQTYGGVGSLNKPDTGYKFTTRGFSTSDAFDKDSGSIDCTIDPIDGVPFGRPFWDTPPTPEPDWGLFGINMTNFKLNCSGQGSIDWSRLVKHISGYNNRPTAGNVAPQLVVNQKGTRLAFNVYENVGPDSDATLPPDIPICGPSNDWLGPRSKGFVDAVELRMNADTPDRLAKSGRRTPDERIGIVASGLAALYGVEEALFANQSYSVAYATLACTDCAQHNHGGAGTLFPAFQVQGSRPRYADLVGTRDGDMVTGSCGRINDISLPSNPQNVAEAGKFYSAPLNSERICAVFSGTPCGNPGRGLQGGADGFFVASPAGEPQTFDKGISGANFGQWVMQYNLPTPQMSFNGQDNLMFDVGRTDTSIPYFSASDRQTLSKQNRKFYDINPSYSNKYNSADRFRTQACAFDHAKGLDWVKNPPCDPRHYDVDPAKGRYGCTNARVVGKHYHDYSVWPFVHADDPSGNISSTAYAKLVPSGLFFSGAAPIDPIMTKGQFLARANQKGKKTYASIRQIFPTSRSILVRSADGNTFTTRFVSAENMTGFDSCQCFVGPNDADGQSAPPGEPYQSTGSRVHPFEGCGFRESWNEGREQPNWNQYACNPANNLTSSEPGYLEEGPYFNCANKDGVGSCWSAELPQSPGPLPQTPGWTKADVNNGTLRDGVGPRWWTEALPGIPSIRFGAWFYFAKTVPTFAPRDIFNKKLYIKADNSTQFDANDLIEWIEVSMLNISGYNDWSLFTIKPDDEKRAYVTSETRDMCADFGRSDNQTKWSTYALTDPLFEAMLNPNTTTISFLNGTGNASKWDRIGNTSVCSGNLHTMPSFSPGVCGPVRELEQTALRQAGESDVPCVFPPIELPVCGNPYFNSQSFGIRRPQLPGNQFAHYCAPALNNRGWYNTSINDPDDLSLVKCEGDVLSESARQDFCAGGGFLGLRGERVAVDRPAESVCGSSGTCVAFAADSVWPLERIIELADKKFVDTYTIVVVPVNASIMTQLPLNVAYEDLTVANRFLYELGNFIDPPDDYPFSQDDRQLRKTPALAAALCEGTMVNLNAKMDDPFESLASVIESMRMTGDRVCNQGPGLTPLECDEGSYCVPMLRTVDGRGLTECVSEAEMFPPVADASVTISRSNVNLVPSAPFGRKIKFGLISGSPPATCTRITVKAKGFKTTDVEFDQSNCGELDESLRVAIVYAGQSAVSSEISNVVIRGAPGAGVAYTGNRDDGDNPYLTVGPNALVTGADAVLSGLSFAVTNLGGSLAGIVAASARTLGTQVITQCAGDGCSALRAVRPDTDCPVDPFCPRGACPYNRTTQACVSNQTHCPDVCAYKVLSDGSIGCFLKRHPTEEKFTVTLDRGIALLKGEVSEACLENVYPFNFSRCDANSARQQWFVQYVAVSESHRINPSGRPYTCFVNFANKSAVLPCDGCDASTEETIRACDSTQPFENVVFETDSQRDETTFVRVAYSNASLGVAAFRNGSCALRDGGVWDDCRTECIDVADAGVCNTTDFVGGLLAACKHSGSLAAVQSQGTCDATSSSTFSVQQSPSPIVFATARCVDGLYELVTHGLGYTSGLASIASDPVQVWTSTAIVQPFDETMTVSGTGVSILNLTELTGLFDRAFEAKLTGADRTTTWYLLGALIAFSIGIIISTVACIRLFNRTPP